MRRIRKSIAHPFSTSRRDWENLALTFLVLGLIVIYKLTRLGVW